MFISEETLADVAAVAEWRARAENELREKMTNGPREDLPSKAIQIETASHPGDCNCGPHIQLFALCEDGSIWTQYHSSGRSNVPTDGMWRRVGGE
ncbi:MAG: hypothetical protein E6Q97_35670 [Desulfurellales bacterium]|nr:MAG: hypothetical protein E6Q97_35670 [Desulfurellales bacterium]